MSHSDKPPPRVRRIGALLGVATCGLVPWACASAPPASPAPPIAPTTTSTEAPPAQAPRVSLGPGEILCGVDDGPVPIGRQELPALPSPDDLRARSAQAFLPIGAAAPRAQIDGRFLGEMAAEPLPPVVLPAKPEVQLRWKIGPGLAPTPAFEERAHACEALVDSNDVGDRTFAMQTNPRTGPAASRLGGEISTSKFTTCFAQALCTLGPGEGDPTSTRSSVQLNTEIKAAVFRGSVRISIVDERRGVAPQDERGRSRRIIPAAGPRSPAGQAYAEQMAAKIRSGAEACAQVTPPDQSFQTMIAFTWGPRGRQLVPIGLGPDPFVASYAACLARAAESVLVRPPPKFNPNDRIPIIAWVDTRPPGPGPMPGMP